MKKLVFVFIMAAFGCSDDDSGTETPPIGRWVEVTALSDTITFLDHEFMMLSRGREIRNGILLPKAGTGSYDYRLQNDKISLRWHLSSNSSYSEYQFNKKDNIITIENFYDHDKTGTIQTFRKLE